MPSTILGLVSNLETWIHGVSPHVPCVSTPTNYGTPVTQHIPLITFHVTPLTFLTIRDIEWFRAPESGKSEAQTNLLAVHLE